MKNIPTDLLRTLIYVVDLGSFTRAAEVQGLTQPAVSAQIRRLQGLIGVELIDKSVPGVALTPIGQLVVSAARRMLSINNQILSICKRGPAARTLRIGIPGDCMGSDLGRMLVGARTQWQNLHFSVQGGGYRRLIQGLKEDQYDIVLALIIDEPGVEARHYWTEQLAWARSERTAIDPEAPVPLVSYKDICVCHRVAVSALNRVGRNSELVFRATSAEGLRSAVAEGIGVMVVPRRRVPAELIVWDDGPLPPLPDVYSGVFVADDCEDETVGRFADHIAAAMRPPVLVAKAS
jgi:DNA-binding transcriptional LysR family regulator